MNVYPIQCSCVAKALAILRACTCRRGLCASALELHALIGLEMWFAYSGSGDFQAAPLAIFGKHLVGEDVLIGRSTRVGGTLLPFVEKIYLCVCVYVCARVCACRRAEVPGILSEMLALLMDGDSSGTYFTETFSPSPGNWYRKRRVHWIDLQILGEVNKKAEGFPLFLSFYVHLHNRFDYTCALFLTKHLYICIAYNTEHLICVEMEQSDFSTENRQQDLRTHALEEIITGRLNKWGQENDNLEEKELVGSSSLLPPPFFFF